MRATSTYDGPMIRTLVVVCALVGLGCGKAADKGSPGEGGSARAPTATPGSGVVAPPSPSRAAKATAVLPTGPGPHAGFDLAAIHARLQGAWLVGGSAFSSIPHVWSLDGDALVTIDDQGHRAATTFRLLSPCSYFAGTPGGSGTYGTFVFDGDTLYLGLGNAGLVQDTRTIACLAAGIYVTDGTTCTLWRRKAFATTGAAWDGESGQCGYTADRSKFQGDDTASSRKIYGVETLEVKGGVLLTRQMEGNKAEQVASIDAALARQKERLDAMAALTRTPTDLPFKTWGLEPGPVVVQGPVWAAAVTRDGRWELRNFRFKQLEDDVVWVTGMTDAWAPSTFVHVVDPVTVKQGGAALLAIGALMPYGRVIKLDGDKAIVRYRSGPRAQDTPIELARVMPIEAAAWTFAAPVAYKAKDHWEDGRLVHATGEDAYVLVESEVKKLPRTEVRLVDVGKRWSKGAKVWAMPDSGMSPLVFVQGTITAVHDDGALYTIKAGDRVFDQTFDRIIGAL